MAITRTQMYVAGGFVGGIVATKLYQYFMGVRAMNAAAASATASTAPVRPNSTNVSPAN